jgi:mRNA interferase MazF
MSMVLDKKRENNKVHTDVRRMSIWWADLRGGNGGSEQTGVRPILIIQNDIGNRYSPTTIVVTISASETKAKLPTHIELDPIQSGLPDSSLILFEQIKTIDEFRLIEKVKQVDREIMEKCDKALAISVGLAYLFN